MKKRLNLSNAAIEERINILSNTPSNEVFPSTCHGTVQYIAGFRDMAYPELVSAQDMLIFLETKCSYVKKPKKYDILTIWSNFKIKGVNGPIVPRLQHSAILTEVYSEKIFHQRNTCDIFEFSTINEYIGEMFPKEFKRELHILNRFYRYF